MDHDQRFKTLIREFFADFLRLFFDDWAARLDLTAVEWLDKEVFPDPPPKAHATASIWWRACRSRRRKRRRP